MLDLNTLADVMSYDIKKYLYLFSGFGPFKGHKVNASWETVKELAKTGLGDGVDLIIYEIPVEYDTVKKVVPEFWEKHSPDVRVTFPQNDLFFFQWGFLILILLN